MKKLAVLSALLLSITGFGVFADEGTDTSKDQGIGDKLLMYIPNRIVDTFDIFSLDLGFGSAAKIDAKATRAFNFGVGTGATGMMIKDYNRQYGFALDSGYDMAFAWIAKEDVAREHSLGSVQEYWRHESGVPKPSERIYDMNLGARDYWEVGVSGALLVQVGASMHPVDIADFVTGFFFYDLKGDDYTVEDLTY